MQSKKTGEGFHNAVSPSSVKNQRFLTPSPQGEGFGDSYFRILQRSDTTPYIIIPIFIENSKHKTGMYKSGYLLFEWGWIKIKENP